MEGIETGVSLRSATAITSAALACKQSGNLHVVIC
jgi:hypothetical protein